ncbi:MAG: adenylosuccinate lyase [Candidatus Heimdallarchaeum endolithica]|uniref:Phosphoribosylformylglycinamidine cyclo-ligase n=1 Tax=Candidatus Heimdallarchaeum endolithica TaxID=2876572 RepID=A0A9Y1FPK0_9ARCH|nr:MAG: adenylosuccinate lyase [Candidatus Heimdallarchaeum endolithica]
MLEIERYKTSIIELFSEEKKLEFQLLVEKTLAQANYEVGKIPEEAISIIEERCSPKYVKLERVKKIEKEVHHDLMSVVLAISEQCGEYGGYIHLGATSYDIQDTVRGLQLKEAKKRILDDLEITVKKLKQLSMKYKNLVCIGRTHGQHAVPTTYGMKFANFLNELLIAKKSLENAKVAYGKMSGAVGTYASYGTEKIEEIVLNKLGLEKQPVTTQVVSRVIYAKYIQALGLIATVLDHFAREIRNLQRTEIDEVRESFVKSQVGSSTMPQKRNPEKSERISGLARNIRASINVAMENICLEHERDLTNSSSERISLFENSMLTHFLILEMNKILASLYLNEEKIKHNLYLKEGAQCSENLMLHLTPYIGRQKAHELLKQLSNFSNFKKVVKENEVVKKYLDAEKIDFILDPVNYIGLAPEIVEKFVESLDKEKKEFSPPSSYAESGLDLDEESEVLKMINDYVQKSFSFGNVIGKEGHYANLIKFGDHGIALSTDGVGTKILVAEQAGKYDTIGIDCVAMNVNDLLAMGILPKAFVDYLAVSKLSKERIEEIIKGIYKGCEISKIPLLGGELATIPEMLKESENSFDIAGTALGIIHLNKIIDGSKIQVGDSILGISSNGMHSNGFTLARKVLFSKYTLDSVIPGGVKLKDELLKPTRIYTEAIEALLDSYEVHGLAHITGGGFRKLFRLSNYGFNLKHFPNPPAIFEEIKRIGKISYNEIFSIFNMGIGFIVIVPKENEEKVLYLLNKYFETHILGEVIEEPNVIIDHYNVFLKR